MAGSAEILAAFRELSNLKQITREELHGLLQDGIHAALAKKHGANVQAEVDRINAETSQKNAASDTSTQQILGERFDARYQRQVAIDQRSKDIDKALEQDRQRTVDQRNAEAEAAKAANTAAQNSSIIQGLAAHVRTRWELAKQAKTEPEERLLQCLRQRNGEYDPDKLAAIRTQGGSEIYMMLTSTKCRGASSWLRDTLLGTGSDKPWSLDSTPIPDLPPDVQRQALEAINQAVQMMIQSTGQMPSEDIVRAELEKKKRRLKE